VNVQREQAREGRTRERVRQVAGLTTGGTFEDLAFEVEDLAFEAQDTRRPLGNARRRFSAVPTSKIRSRRVSTPTACSRSHAHGEHVTDERDAGLGDLVDGDRPE
jgi:hypothetical protein